MADQVDGLLSPWLRKKRMAAVRPYLQGRVLDYGCGIGMLAELCQPDFYLGVDRDVESLESAKEKFPEFHFAQAVPENSTFDTIFLLALIEHIAKPEDFLRQLKLMLKPHGQVVLTTPHPLIERIHFIGSKIGLFSRHANEEHEELIDYAAMERMGSQVGFVLDGCKRFLFGANQLFILKKNEEY